MPKPIGIDFGTSNTVIAFWDEQKSQGVPINFPDIGRQCTFNGEMISVVPSTIHYSQEGARWIGQQVSDKDLSSSERTFSLMKRYISQRSPVKRKLDGREVTHSDAGRDFLSAVLLNAKTQLDIDQEEVAVSAPVEAFEHYADWLTTITQQFGMNRIRLIDEPSAAALGYGAHVQPGHVYLVFDFGGGTLDAAMVLIEEQNAAEFGRRCRVLGKAGKDLGGASIDALLMQQVLKRNQINPVDELARSISRPLLLQCRAAKEALSSSPKADIRITDPKSGREICAELTQSEFESLLDDHGVFTQLDQTVRRAINASRERGYDEEHIQNVLMVGGSSLIPSVQKAIQRTFGRDKVRQERPLDAVARGAAAFVAGVDFYDHIQHDYAIRWLNPEKGDYDYRTLVKRGTNYPTTEPVARMTIKATFAGQKDLGIAIFEIAEQRGGQVGGAMEIIFDPLGAARLVTPSEEEQHQRKYFWINESSQTFLHADPPASKGEQRFTVEFGIDASKRLTITAKDLRTGLTTLNQHPVVKLT